ncbi:MAG: SDR family NAD(P)-dependent oxidoreductase [Henriciella sp.]
MDKPLTLIIGLGQTVGEAIAKRVLEDGHHVLAVDPNQTSIDELKKATSGKTELFVGQTHNRLGLRNALAAAMEQFDRVDHIISIPELPEADTILDLDMDDFQGALERTSWAAVETIRIFSQAMLEREQEQGATMGQNRQVGTFTFVLSLSAELSRVGSFTESVTQNAIFGIVKAASIELANQGIRVNAVIALRPRDEQNDEWLKKRTPVGRAAQAEEIAEAAVFLSHPSSAIITGQSIILDGGRQRLSGILADPDED